MSDVSVTAANARPGAGSSVDKRFNFGATVTQGQPVYLDTSNAWQLALSGGTAAQANVGGLAMNGGASGQPASVVTAGNAVVPGFTGAAGDTVWLSASAGHMTITAADTLVTGQFVCVLGVMTSATAMIFQPVNSTVAVP